MYSICFNELKHAQSGGNQVAYNAALVAAVIQTSSVNADYECSILRSVRDYEVGSDKLSQSYFRLRVLVEQIVYVDAKEVVLTLQEVTSIVETGFTRGQGGRVQFRSLLMLHPAFRTVVNVEVLGSFPSLAPSTNPSESVTIPLSPAPSAGEMSNPPSHRSPWTSSPVMQPSYDPSQGPVTSGGPSSNPSTLPSSIVANSTSPRPVGIESLEPTVSPKSPRKNDRALIVGAIIGGVAIIMASLFFLFCIWWPFCVRQKSNDLSDPEDSRGAYPVVTSSSQSSSPNAMVVPNLLTLDDDMISLANTTLDGKSSALVFSPSQNGSTHQHGTLPIFSNESFDESSIYTSNTDPSNAANAQNSLASVSTKNPPETKQFDPFDDDHAHFADDESSIGFAIGAPPYDPLGSCSKLNDGLPNSSNESHSDIVDNLVVSDPSVLPFVGDDSVTLSSIDISGQAENSTLREHFLKDTVVNTASDSLKSHASLQSAPSRLFDHGADHGPVPKGQVSSSNGRPPQYGNRRIGADKNVALRTGSKSSRSLDEASRSRFLPKGASTQPMMTHNKFASKQSKFILRKSISESHDPILDEFVGLQMPSTDANIVENDVSMNILARKPLFEAVLRDETDAPTYNSGLFGASSGVSSIYDTSSESGRSGSWLVDTDENTLDSHHHVSNKSVSSHSSHSSNLSSFGTRRSLQSFTFGGSGEQVSTEHIGNHLEQRIKDNAGGDGIRSNQNFRSTAVVHEEKSGEYLHYPDSSHRTSLSIAGGTSSISGSSASRSTLSSKFDSHYEKSYVEVFVPPGKINIVLADFRNGSGTIISEVRSSSALLGKLSPGDELGKLCRMLLRI